MTLHSDNIPEIDQIRYYAPKIDEFAPFLKEMRQEQKKKLNLKFKEERVMKTNRTKRPQRLPSVSPTYQKNRNRPTHTSVESSLNVSRTENYIFAMPSTRDISEKIIKGKKSVQNLDISPKSQPFKYNTGQRRYNQDKVPNTTHEEETPIHNLVTNGSFLGPRQNRILLNQQNNNSLLSNRSEND